MSLQSMVMPKMYSYTGRAPWNKGKTVAKDGIYSPRVLRKMRLGQRTDNSILL